MATYNIVEKSLNKVVFTYSTNGGSALYGRDDWDDPTLFEHILIEEPAPPPAPPRKIMSKWEFRKLFSLEERVACDNAPDNTQIPEQYRAILKTLNTDFALAEQIDPALKDVQDGVQLLEQVGLLATGRAAQILYEV
jgi:hypothetical protein